MKKIMMTMIWHLNDDDDDEYHDDYDSDDGDRHDGYPNFHKILKRR